MDNRNLIIAVVLAGLVVVFFGIVLPLITGKDKDEKEKPQKEQVLADDEMDEEEDEVAYEDLDEEDLGVDDDEEEDLLEAEPEVVAAPVTLETEAFTVVLGPRGGGIRSLTLKNERYVKESKSGKTRPVDVVSRGPSGKPRA